MSLTKQQLEALNNSSFPNNNAGFITPELLRTYNSSSIAAFVDEIAYNVDSASFNTRIAAITGSSLITASVTQSTITFTKGDGSQFNIVVADVSGSTGNFATTGSNTFVGAQTITGSNGRLQYSGTNLPDTSLASIHANNDEPWLERFYNDTFSTSSAVMAYFAWNDGRFVFHNESTQSIGIGVNGDYNNPELLVYEDKAVIKNDLFVSGNVYATNLTGSTIDTSSFATTGSNTFTGEQIISSSLIVTNSIKGTGSINLQPDQTDARLIEIYNTAATDTHITASGGNLFLGNDETFVLVTTYSNQKEVTIRGDLGINISGSITSSNDISTSANIYAANLTASGGNISVQDEGTILGNVTSFNFNGAGVTASVSAGTASITIAGGGSINTGSFATTGSNTFIGNQIISGATYYQGDQFVSGNITVGNGYTTHLENTWVKALICTSSVTIKAGGLTSTGSIVTTGDVTANGGITATNDISTSANISALNFNALQASSSTFLTTASFNTFTSSQIVSNSYFATTGSNTFVGSQWFSDTATNTYSALSEWSGSLILSAKGYTTSSFPQLTSSLAAAAGTGFVNLLFKGDSAAANTILSGSNNILANPVAPTATFYRQVGNGNLALLGTLPQVSASMLFPITMNGNIINGTGNPIIMRGPVSSSGWTINANNIQGTLNLGPSTALHAEKLVSAVSLTVNTIPGTLSIVANQSTITGSTTILGNTIAGGVTLNLSSSAITMNNNIVNDSSCTLTNGFYSSSLGFGTLTLSRNNIAGQTNSIIVSGSQPTGTTNSPSFSDNFIGGGNNTIYGDTSNAAIVSTNAYHNAIRNIVFGQQLIITGSSLLSDTNSFGSAFFGRWNDLSGNKDLTAQTIFAVGTGTSTTRKTGFLIDSGSNTFVEGTFNVSGSTAFTGSVAIANSGTNQLLLPSGSNTQTGLATLDGGNPGAVTVSNSLVTANSIIMLTKQTLTNAHMVAVSSKGSGTFTITSNGNGDTDVVAFMIINPS